MLIKLRNYWNDERPTNTAIVGHIKKYCNKEIDILTCLFFENVTLDLFFIFLLSCFVGDLVLVASSGAILIFKMCQPQAAHDLERRSNPTCRLFFLQKIKPIQDSIFDLYLCHLNLAAYFFPSTMKSVINWTHMWDFIQSKFKHWSSIKVDFH